MERLFRRVRISVSLSALITLALGLALTAVLFGSIRRIEFQAGKVQFEQKARLRTAAITTGLDDSVEQLQLLNELFRTFGTVSRAQFHSFTAPILHRYPEIHALSFQRRILHQDRVRFQAMMRQRFPDFAITEFVGGKQRPAAERDSYNVVDYIEPSAGNEAAFGLDTGSSSDQIAVRARSRNTGKVVATGLLSLVQHKGWHTGFLLLAPVYMKGAPLDTPAERTRATIGETAAVFRVDHLIHTILASRGFTESPEMTVSVYASAHADGQQLAYRNGNVAPPARSVPVIPAWLMYDQAEPIVAEFNLAGNPWHIEVTQAAAPFTATHSGSLYALLGGLLSSLLAAAYVYSLAERRQTERLMGERTAALQFANLRLLEDVALRERTEQSLRLRERVIEVSANAIIICSAQAPDYAIEYVNAAFEQITGYSAHEVVGQRLDTLQGSGQDTRNLEEIRSALRECREGRALLRNYRKDGSSYWNELFIAPVGDDNGKISHFVVAQYDITAVLRHEAELEFQARHDALTGLANRILLQERLTQAIAAARLDGTPLWVVFVDLDRFKFINDTLGHQAGDTLLKTLAARLQAAVGEADTVARMGGDEFVVVLPCSGENGSCVAVLECIMAAVAEPLSLQHHEFFLTCSIGVASYPVDGETAEGLTKHADIAMYRAKELGRNNFQFYTASMNERTLERLQIEADLRHALERDEFLLHYQPQVDLLSGTVVGMEVLLRWKHPVLGMIEPARFIGLAEEMGLIIPVGAWVIRTACHQTKAWDQAGLGRLRVAVNLSPRQFTQKTLVDSIAAVLAETGLEAVCLELELTESMVMDDVDNAITILRSLKRLGIKISIDDFGTGYSSLSYLRRFPIDVLKIDQSFVADLSANPDDAAIVVSIISLAHSLRLKVIAEGVETAEQLAFLRSWGCDQMQGYYFSRPVTAAAFEQLLREARSLPQPMETVE